MKKLTNIFLIFVFLGVSLFPAIDIGAQSFEETIEPGDIQLTLNPSTPGTNEIITARLESLLVNINRMLITWFVNGEIVKSGYGETQIRFNTGEQGQTTAIEAYIQVDNQNAVRKWAQVAPADLDILWEANTYTPPFYRGKALPTPESFIKIVGIPNVRNEGAQRLENGTVFNWNHAGKNLPNESGYGKNPLVIRNDFLRNEEDIELTVVHKDGFTQAQSAVNIQIQRPKTIVYEENSYLRLANKATVREPGKQLVFTAQPFYFSTKRELMNILDFRWVINSETQTQQTSERKNELIATSRGGVTTEIGIEVNHPNKPLQSTPLQNFTVIQ